MPVYACKIRGDDKVRIVRAKTQSQAAKHLVDADIMNAEELADAIGKGSTIETATVAEDPPAQPDGGDKDK